MQIKHLQKKGKHTLYYIIFILKEQCTWIKSSWKCEGSVVKSDRKRMQTKWLWRAKAKSRPPKQETYMKCLEAGNESNG